MLHSINEKIQQQIYELLKKQPGLYLSKIAELLNKPVVDIEYHLNILRLQGLIVDVKEENYIRYYVKKRRIKTRERRTIETRQQIYTIIAENPGLHLSKLAEMLDISVPLADYHLLALQKDGRITTVKDKKGFFKRYYISNELITTEEKSILEILRKKIPLQIIFLLLKTPGLNHKDIMEKLNMPSSSLSYHLTTLEEQGILEAHPHGRERGYTIRNKDEVIRILKKYEFSIETDLTIDSFKDLWDSLDFHRSLEKE